MKKPSRPEIPRKAVYRLSIYLRCLLRLKDNGLPTIASEALARAAGVKPTQLRKDLAYFGTFGTRGLGYDVEQLGAMIAAGASRLSASKKLRLLADAAEGEEDCGFVHQDSL